MVIGLKMILHGHVHVPHALSLGLIAGIIATGVIASIVSNRRADAAASLTAMQPAEIPPPPPPEPDEPPGARPL